MELLTLPGHRVKHRRLFLCNMKKQRTHYDKAFKENAVKLGLERKNVSELARELGIAPFLFYRWRKEFRQKGDSVLRGNGGRSLSEDAKRIVEPEKRPG